jgi:hypothetical protein
MDKKTIRVIVIGATVFGSIVFLPEQLPGGFQKSAVLDVLVVLALLRFFLCTRTRPEVLPTISRTQFRYAIKLAISGALVIAVSLIYWIGSLYYQVGNPYVASAVAVFAFCCGVGLMCVFFLQLAFLMLGLARWVRDDGIFRD